jgi:hypothetical protein
MKWRCALPKAVNEPARAVVAEALKQTGCHSRGLLVCFYRGRPGNRVSGHARQNTIRFHQYTSRRLKGGSRRYRHTTTDCDGRICMTAGWPPYDPLTWATEVYSTALHEAAHVADRGWYPRGDRRLPHDERPVEAVAYAAQHEGMRRLTLRRQELLLALAVAAEDCLKTARTRQAGHIGRKGCIRVSVRRRK